MKLLVVDYAEAESMWVGETPKNIAATFRAAAEQKAVLLFDEADAIATRRSAGGGLPYEREMNLTVNVLLRELEAFNGIVIFATNLAANFDPAFERRIRTHVLFEMPAAQERSEIWKLQVHPKKTPLAPDVDFQRLGEKYVLSGGDIKNAVIKAAGAAAAESGPQLEKRISQRHFESAAEEVISAKAVMQQSLFVSPLPAPVHAPAPAGAPWRKLEARWRAAVLASLVLAGAAFLAALFALTLVVTLR
jgi:SpoVK/Ycf46/Vps4 family AAA+-type ATPase